MSLSKNQKYIITSNKQTVEIHNAYENPTRTNIVLDCVLVVNFNSLPLTIDSIHDFSFSNSDNNVFYAIGRHNSNFYDNMPDMEDESFGSSSSHKIEKFFIENETFSSETIAHFEMSNEHEEIDMYCFSDSLCKVIILSNFNNLYSFMIRENVQQINKLQGSELKENILAIKWYFNDTLLSVLTSKSRVLILDTYLRLYTMSLVTFDPTHFVKRPSQFIELQSYGTTHHENMKSNYKAVQRRNKGMGLKGSVDMNDELAQYFDDDEEEEAKQASDRLSNKDENVFKKKELVFDSKAFLKNQYDYKFYGNNNYQIVTPIDQEQKINDDEENVKVYNYSNPCIMVYNSNIVRFYLFEMGMNFELIEDNPPTIDDIFIIKVLKSKLNHRHMLKYLTY